ncbi:Uncharacterized protein FKW44_013365 [Caligus rogercresseyi]|uniref:Uncharacterized protein n=1 Tax=Caligus rogercresseyi TaxID=217165 RepID=A0A7T8HKS6_CALRO|nr:Uncharacterized protein FKW44_013365 [Caligus rogercresseyi]
MDFTSPLMIISSNKIGLRPGIYFEDKDDGNTIDELAQRISLIGYLRNGKLNGVVRRYGRFSTDPDHQCKKPIFQGISFIGHYENGVPSGPSWRVVPGGGLLYGTTEDMEFTGENLAYIYPDLETAIIGRFKKGLLVEGREAKLERVRCVNGIYEAQFSEPDGPSYHYRRPTNATFGDQPHLPDPLDKKYFTVKSSTIDHPLSSEGAFAIRDISAGTLMALYSGIILSNEEKKVFNERYETENRAKGLDISEDEAHAYYKYHITLKGCKHIITVPFEKTSLDEIKSTMGHKVNHSFEPNCEIGDLLDTPRQGIIMTLSTLRDIKKGKSCLLIIIIKRGTFHLGIESSTKKPMGM